MDDVTTRIHLAFDAVARPGDAHPYLGGDRITLSDLSFAASAAPLVLRAGYAAPVPSLEHMPPELRGIASELRIHPAAKRVAAVYAPHARAVD
jgi:glutathione S-transferase